MKTEWFYYFYRGISRNIVSQSGITFSLCRRAPKEVTLAERDASSVLTETSSWWNAAFVPIDTLADSMRVTTIQKPEYH